MQKKKAAIHKRKILTDRQLFSLKLLCLRCGQNFIIDQLIGLIKGFDHLGRFRMEIDFIQRLGFGRVPDSAFQDMISQIEFVRMVDVQSETVERYIKDGKVKPDLSIPFGDKRMFHYFREESIRNIAKQYGWDLITPQNMADKFMKFIETMDMSYSYKPVLLKAIYEYMDTSGRVALPDVVDYFIDFYENRKAHGMIAEKSTSIYQKGGYTRKDVEKNILSNPFKRFEDMRFLMRCKDVETIEVNPIIFRKLTREDWLHIVNVCDKSLEKYYLRLKK